MVDEGERVSLSGNWSKIHALPLFGAPTSVNFSILRAFHIRAVEINQTNIINIFIQSSIAVVSHRDRFERTPFPTVLRERRR